MAFRRGTVLFRGVGHVRVPHEGQSMPSTSSSQQAFRRYWRMRKPRELREGARYHVTARANRKEMILESRANRDLFLSVVRRAKRKYSFRIENFCVMGNHYHLVIVPMKGESLSAIMRWIMGVFAMAFNKLHGYVGHVWCERYFSRVIASIRDLVATFDYIDNNPVRAMLVEDGAAWPYGGLWESLSGRHDLTEGDSPLIRLLFPDRQIRLLPSSRH